MFPPEEHELRRKRLLEAMAAEKLDALILYAAKSESGYVRYYTGFESQLGIMDCSFLAVTPGYRSEWTLVTNAFWDEPAVEGCNTVITGNFPWTIANLIPSATHRIGIAPLRQFPADTCLAITQACRSAKICDVKPLMLRLRAVKSALEIDVLRKIAAIADAGAEAFVRSVRPGARELEIAADVEYALRRAGSGPFIFSTILCSGPRTAPFISLPTERKLENGDLVLLDCGPSIDGYHGDFSRCIFAGEPRADSLTLAEHTSMLYEECFAHLKVGAQASDVAESVLQRAADLQYGPEHLYHSPNVRAGFVGHGIGLGNPDAPQLSTEDRTLIEEGMVINIETILRRNQISARIEDAVVIGHDGAIRLSKTAPRLWASIS
jgi:Xaa-Pro aminopeptidase